GWRGSCRIGHAPSCARCAGYEIGHRRFDAARAQSLDQLAASPVTIGAVFEVLDGAAAAIAKVPAGGFDTLRRCIEQGDDVSAIPVSRNVGGLARQREGYEQRPLRRVDDTVALRAKTVDGDDA